MQKIKQNCIIPSGTFSVPRSAIKFYDPSLKKAPEVGDLIFAEVVELGHHRCLESKSGRIHTINIGTRAVFVFGNRYAPDQFEGLVPDSYTEIIELFSQGGVVGNVNCQNQLIGRATTLKVLGYICNSDGKTINSREHVLVKPKSLERKSSGAKLILCVGTSMNSGKTKAAAACCYALSSMDKKVRAAKITGTASQKDILLMNDCGAEHIVDFTYFGYPSTYMLDTNSLLSIFNAFDMKYGNNPKTYLVVEIADGIFQRETAKLLRTDKIRNRIHKLIFCAPDSSAVYGGIKALKENFNLVPDAISGVCSSSPLAMREIETFLEVPILKSMEQDYQTIFNIIA